MRFIALDVSIKTLVERARHWIAVLYIPAGVALLRASCKKRDSLKFYSVELLHRHNVLARPPVQCLPGLKLRTQNEHVGARLLWLAVVVGSESDERRQ